MIKGIINHLGVNDDHATLVEWVVEKGQFVKKGETIAEVETTKVAIEIDAEGEGYFQPVILAGDTFEIGQLIYVLTDKPEDLIDKIIAESKKIQQAQEVAIVGKGRWTKKAEILARKKGIEISKITAVGVIREADVLAYEEGKGHDKGSSVDLVEDFYSDGRPQRMIVLGAGRGAVQVIDVIHRLIDYRAIGILDDNTKNLDHSIMGVPINGKVDEASELYKQGKFDCAIIAFSNDLEARCRTFQELSAQGVPFGNVIDPSVQLHSNLKMGTGNVIIAGSRIGACATIGDNNFLSAYVNIEHHNILGSHCTFGPGNMTSSRVHIGDKCCFGTGIFIEPGVTVGSRSIVASGAILTRDIPEKSTVKTKVQQIIRSL